jgi:hypothetical protein
MIGRQGPLGLLQAGLCAKIPGTTSGTNLGGAAPIANARESELASAWFSRAAFSE